MEHPKVLVFVEFPNPEFPKGGFLNHLAYPDVELTGFYALDDDGSIEAAQAEYEEEFSTELKDQAEKFEHVGIRTEYELIFGHNSAEARQKAAHSDDVDAVLLPGGANTIGKVLLAVRHTQNAEEKVANLLNIVDRDDLISIGLIHVADPDDPDSEPHGKQILEEMTSALTDEGIPSVHINREVRTGSDVAFELNKAARNYDLAVLGETQQDLGDEIFGSVGEYIIDEQDTPVLIVR